MKRLIPGVALSLALLVQSSVAGAQDEEEVQVAAGAEPDQVAAGNEPDQVATGNEPRFDLFGDLNSGSSSRGPAGPGPGGSSGGDDNAGRNRSSDPEFTLVGTSRIGNRHSAFLQHSSGEDILVKNVDPTTATLIPEHENFAIVYIGPGEVSIRYPEDSPCVDFANQGVDCNDEVNVAALSLTTGEVLESTRPSREGGSTTATEPAGNEQQQEQQEQQAQPRPVTNPFEVLRNRGAGNNAAASRGGANRNSFSPRRIAPEDVPPGMRVVSTPFGDRLVEQ